MTVAAPTRSRYGGENFVLAEAVVRRYGFEVTTIVRIDDAGKVYPRLADGEDVPELTIRELGDDHA